MNLPKYRWPLMNDPFTMWDRLKLSAFVCNPSNRWTQGEQVKLFEQEMAEYIGCRHAIFVSSGSTANTVLAMYLKDSRVSTLRNTVIFPSTTWTTSVSPFLREGFTPRFIDISFSDLSLDLDRLETYLFEHHETTAAVFVTSLLGMCPDIARLNMLQARYPDVRFWMDNCENHLSKYNSRNASYFFTSTTSTYWGHMTTSGEGGFIFTNSDKERDYALMARNHGMTRSVENPNLYRNHDVDARFDFYLLGNNFRNTDIAAFVGRMDAKRIDSYFEKRRNLYRLFMTALDQSKLLYFTDRAGVENAMFAIPLIINPSANVTDEQKTTIKNQIEQFCKEEGIETRPVISGNLLAQRCYKQYGLRADYPTSEYVHKFGMYVGLYPGLHEDMVRKLAGFLNEL